MKSNLYLAILFLIPVYLFSQNSNDKTVYLDSLWKETTKENHKYYRIFKDYNIDKDSYKVYEYYKSGKLEMVGTSSTKENLTREGEFIFYYENGNKESVENYVKSKLDGKLNQWYENGNKRFIGYYKNGKKSGKQLLYYENGNLEEEGEYTESDEAGKYYKLNQYWDLNNKQLIIDGNGNYFYDNKIDYIATGIYKDGFKNGIWKEVNSKYNYSLTEIYENGKFVSGIRINADKSKSEYFELQKQPEPKKGIQDFRNFIGKNFLYTDIAIKNKIKGQIIIEFVVNAQGKIIEPKIKKGLGYGLDEEAIRVVTSYENWIPGEQRGNKVRTNFTIPIKLAGSE